MTRENSSWEVQVKVECGLHMLKVVVRVVKPAGDLEGTTSNGVSERALHQYLLL